MTTVSDDFARPDGPLGANWQNSIGPGPCQIVSGACTGTASGAYTYNVWAFSGSGGVDIAPDQWVQASFPTMGANGGAGIAVRCDINQDAYLMMLAGGTLTLYTTFPYSAWVTLATAGVTPAPGDVWRLEVAGNPGVITARQNGVQVLQATDDTSQVQGGNPAVWAYSGTDTITAWSGGDYGTDGGGGGAQDIPRQYPEPGIARVFVPGLARVYEPALADQNPP